MPSGVQTGVRFRFFPAKYNEALPDSLLEGAGFVYEPALKFWYVPAPSA